MDRTELRDILARWRPDSPSGHESDVREALAEAARHPESAAWLDQHEKFQSGTRAALTDLPVPVDLASSILARQRVRRVRFATLWLAAACVTASVAWLFLSVVRNPIEPDPKLLGNDLATFRNRMVRAALREYRMDITSGDLAALREFLKRNRAPSEFSLPKGLAALAPVGAGILPWQSSPTSMVCLNTPSDGMLFLFVAPASEFRDPPPTEGEFQQINRLGTRAWSDHGLVYVLASEASIERLRQYF